MSTPMQPQSHDGSVDPESRCPSLLSDLDDLIPLRNSLGDEEIVLLLTPVIIPPNPYTHGTSDPFEPLGRALAKEYPLVRHVPYTKKRGITSTHVEFLKRAGLTIFVATPLSSSSEPSHFESAMDVREILEDRPLIVVVCCSPQDEELADEELPETEFPTVIAVPGISVPELESVAQLLIEGPLDIESTSTTSALSHEYWTVENCDLERDLDDMYGLWCSTVAKKFHLPRHSFDQLARRNGFSFNCVVREPSNGDLVGFCVTWVSFQGRSVFSLVGSMAALIVREDFQGRGIGRALHDESVSRLNKRPDLRLVNLGSIFPRFFRGIPDQSSDTKFFEHRGWNLSGTAPGTGQTVTDWVLNFVDHPHSDLATAGLTFRPCTLLDWNSVFTMVDNYALKWSYFGYYDQFARTLDSSHMGDVILGFEGDNLVAGAVTYLPGSDSQTATDLVWAATAGSNLGGLSCIVIKGKHPFFL